MVPISPVVPVKLTYIVIKLTPHFLYLAFNSHFHIYILRAQGFYCTQPSFLFLLKLGVVEIKNKSKQNAI